MGTAWPSASSTLNAPEGAPYGPRFVMKRVWAGDQSAPDIVALPGGEILVAWQSTDEDRSDESAGSRLL